MMSEFRGREGVPKIRTFSDKGEGGVKGIQTSEFPNQNLFSYGLN